MRLLIVAAVARNRVIGRDGKLPWHLPEDLKRFKALTWGGAVIMGRKTYESIGRPLPGRLNIVLTRRPDNLRVPADVARAGSLDEAIAIARSRKVEKAFVIGGARVYAEALPRADGLHLTLVEREADGDTTFPPWDPSAWREIRREPGDGVTFVEYARASPRG